MTGVIRRVKIGKLGESTVRRDYDDDKRTLASHYSRIATKSQN